MNRRAVAFVTSLEYQDLTPSDQIAASAFRTRGVNVIPAMWDDSAVQWEEFQAAIIRSPWDYHLRPEQFLAWLDSLERKGVKVWNPLTILRWNLDKHYLRELEGKNILVPSTVYVEKMHAFDLPAVRSVIGVDEVVVKPAISASAWQTKRIQLSRFSTVEMNEITKILTGTSVMVQEFMPEVVTEGEWSFLFFGSEFSHAVRKQPMMGDFRVQEEHGGTYDLATPSPDLIEQARKIVTSIDLPLLYARVDGIVRSSRLILMELELLEPALFFDAKEEAAVAFFDRFCDLSEADSSP